MQREGPLDTNPEGDLPNRERLADPTPGTTDDDPLEDLNALTIALDDTDMDLDRVARAEIRDVVAQEGLLDRASDLNHKTLCAQRVHKTDVILDRSAMRSDGS